MLRRVALGPRWRRCRGPQRRRQWAAYVRPLGHQNDVNCEGRRLKAVHRPMAEPFAIKTFRFQRDRVPPQASQMMIVVPAGRTVGMWILQATKAFEAKQPYRSARQNPTWWLQATGCHRLSRCIAHQFKRAHSAAIVPSCLSLAVFYRTLDSGVGVVL